MLCCSRSLKTTKLSFSRQVLFTNEDDVKSLFFVITSIFVTGSRRRSRPDIGTLTLSYKGFFGLAGHGGGGGGWNPSHLYNFSSI